MGCIFSLCKLNHENYNEPESSFLVTHKHCLICNKTFTFNKYNKHIVTCGKISVTK